MHARGLIIQTRSIFASGIHGGLPTTYVLIYFKSQLIEHSLRFFEIELNRSGFTDRWWSFCPKSIHASLLTMLRNGAWPLHQIHSNSPQTHTQSGQMEAKIFPCRFLVSCKFLAGVAVVVGGFTAAVKISTVTR